MSGRYNSPIWPHPLTANRTTNRTIILTRIFDDLRYIISVYTTRCYYVNKMLETIEINPEQDADCCFICLHGLGANGYDFVSEPGKTPMGMPKNLNMRFVFPHAPVRKITWADGKQLRGWFNVVSLDEGDYRDDIVGMTDSAELIQGLIEAEVSRGIPSTRIVLGGFSQGGVMALYLGLRSQRQLGGIVSLSAWLAGRETVTAAQDNINGSTPIFIAHGTADDLIPLDWAEKSHASLVKLGYDVAMLEYPMGHNICAKELLDLGFWAHRVLTRSS